MDNIVPSYLIDLLFISATTSVIIMAVIQQFKNLVFIKKDWHVWLINLFFSFGIGIPFAVVFYDLNIVDSIWVSLFSFVGAPTIYDLLKKQNIVNYKPKSLDDKIIVSKDREIKRD